MQFASFFYFSFFYFIFNSASSRMKWSCHPKTMTLKKESTRCDKTDRLQGQSYQEGPWKLSVIFFVLLKIHAHTFCSIDSQSISAEGSSFLLALTRVFLEFSSKMHFLNQSYIIKIGRSLEQFPLIRLRSDDPSVPFRSCRLFEYNTLSLCF